MVHPNVLKASGVDPNEFTGFAFGLGLTHLAMMKYGVSDIRWLNAGDLRDHETRTAQRRCDHREGLTRRHADFAQLDS